MGSKNRFCRNSLPPALLLVAVAAFAPAAATAQSAEDEVNRILAQAALKESPNPVVLELLLADGVHGLSAEQRALAEQQIIAGLRDRTIVNAYDSMGAMMGSMKDVVKSTFKPKNILKNTFGLGDPQNSDANQIIAEAIVGPWVRGLAAAGTLADAGYKRDAAAFYQRCLGEPLLAPSPDGEMSAGSFGEWVRARCQKELVGHGVAIAGPIFADLTQGQTGNPATPAEDSAPVARASGLAGLAALLEAGELELEQRKAVVNAALAVVDQPKKELDDALASAAANVLGNSGLPEARDALLDLAEKAKPGRFKLGRKSDLENTARNVKLALARGFDHRPSVEQLKTDLLKGRGLEQWQAFETLFNMEEPQALNWARQQLEQMKSQDPAAWAEPLIEKLGSDGGPLSLEALHDTEPETTLPDDYVQAKLDISLFENGERDRLPSLAAAIERDTWNLGGSALKQGANILKPLAIVAARHVLGLPIPQGPSDRMLVDFALGAATRLDRQQEAEVAAVRKMRLRIATALSTWDDPRAVPLINRMLELGDEPTRIGAARALLGQTSPESIPDLLAALDVDYGVDDDEPRAPEIQAALLLHAGREFAAHPDVRLVFADFERFEYESVRFVAAAVAAALSGGARR